MTGSETDPVLESLRLDGRELPESVAIVAMGPTCASYLINAKAEWDRRRFADETWAINAMGGVIQHDRLVAMDDLKIQQARADARPETGIAAMMNGWMRTHPGPIYTPVAYPEWPGAVEYPLEWVINRTGHCYFNNTVPYAFALAVAMGVKVIHLYGTDYSYDGPGHAHKRERGRACLEYWIALAIERGVQVHLPQDTSLLDMAEDDSLYGYDAVQLTIESDEDGFHVTRQMRPPEEIPTADEMEIRYSHDVRLEQLLQEKKREAQACQG
jgi:hypothetical protein